MISKRISTILLAVVTANLLVGSNAFAAEKIMRTVSVDVSGSESFDELNVVIDENKTTPKTSKTSKKTTKSVKTTNTKSAEVKVAEAKAESKENCEFNYADIETNTAKVVSVRRQLKVEPGESFRVKVFMQNTGNGPWFSGKSTCHGPKMYLGTDKERDHDSTFYQKGSPGWESANRILMDQMRVDPGQIASFTFWAKAGKSADVYKEYFSPLLKDIQWIENTPITLDVIIGDTGENAEDVRNKISFSRKSGSVTDLDLNGPKTIKVNLTEQKIYAYLGDTDVRDFRVSTGKPSTPTPTGTYNILIKQDVRVGFAAPHYIMPRFMMFQSSGYGFHALPSLARNGGDAFWTEARNHIGIPVSHGCVRLLPEDADWLFDFTDIGTKVEITY